MLDVPETNFNQSSVGAGLPRDSDSSDNLAACSDAIAGQARANATTR